jgi:hypothetical protein
MKTYKGLINKLEKNQIFVFGANFSGIHGAGSAKAALQFGAIYGKLGYVGQTWSIVTKDLKKYVHPSVSVDVIVAQIKELYIFAENHKELDFMIAYSGSGTNLNGYTPKQMAEMFSQFVIPENIVFEEEFSKLLINNFEI